MQASEFTTSIMSIFGVLASDYSLLLFTLLAVAAFSTAILLCYLHCLRPYVLRQALLQQGFTVLPYRFIGGDLPQLERMEAEAQRSHIASPYHHHLLLPHVFPFQTMILSQHPGSRVVYWWGNSPTLLISKADDARSIYSKDVKYMQKPSYTTKSFHRLVGSGLLLANGKDWHLQRNILQPAFFSEKLKGLVTDMTASSLDIIRTWKKRVDMEGDMADVEVEVARDLKNVTADILARTMFGASYLKGKSVFETQECLMEMISKLRIQFSLIPFYEYLPTGQNRKLWAMDRRNNETLREIIELRKRNVAANNAESGSGCPYGTDLLGLMLGSVDEEAELGSHLSTQQVIDECKTFFFAGHDTTSNLLAWTLVLLSLHQEWQEKAREEVWEVLGKEGVPSADNLNKLKVVGMILNETLRLYPPVPEFGPREVFENVRMDDGTVLPRGLRARVACLYINRDKESWGADADEFRPDRFARGVSHACKNPYAFMPFGNGPRICIGQNFAIMEAKVILALILQHFQFRLSPSYCHAPITAITMRPKHGVHLLLRALSKE